MSALRALARPAGLSVDVADGSNSDTPARWRKASSVVQASRLLNTQGLKGPPEPKRKSTWGSADRFDSPIKSWVTSASKTDPRMDSLTAEALEPGAKVVMEPTRCAPTPPSTQPAQCTSLFGLLTAEVTV